MNKSILTVALLSAVPLSAQNLIQNPGFEGATLSPWTHNDGPILQAGVEMYDVTGKGASKAVACTPHSNNYFVLDQGLIPVQAGRRYQFEMKVASFWPNPNNASQQADAGRFTVFLGSQVVASLSLGIVYAAAPLIRRDMSAEFTASQSGLLALRVQIHRIYRGLYGTTPRCYVDDVSLTPLLSAMPYGNPCGSPLYNATLTGTGQQLQLEQKVYTGRAGSAGLMMIGLRQVQVSFLGCTLLTDGIVNLPYAMDSTGSWSLKVPVPAGFTGPLTIQHLVRLPGNKIEATHGVEIR